MAKPHCDKHKRYVPYCDDCKAIVKAAEEAVLQAERDALAESPEAEEEEARAKQDVLEEAVREEESNALKEEVGFPGAQEEVPETGEPVEGDIGEEQPADPEGPLPEGGPGPDAEPIPDPWADGKTPEAGQDVGNWVPPCQREDAPMACLDCGGECQGHPDPGAEFETIEVTAEVKRLIVAVEEAISNGEGVTVLMGDAEKRLRQEGRKEVIALVRDYFADSIDTGAFQLLEYLERKCNDG